MNKLSKLETTGNLFDIEVIKQYLQSVDVSLNTTFQEDPFTNITDLLKTRAVRFAEAIQVLWQNAHAYDCSDTPYLTLLATGGFGRGELHPHSDIDLLVLHEQPLVKEQVAGLEQFISYCWDVGLPVSHSVRSLMQSVEEASIDVGFLTSIMESRLLSGDAVVLRQLQMHVDSNQMWAPADYFAAKLEEQIQRHLRFDDTARQLEPNIKQGPGGLRDLQTIGWVCRRRFGDSDLATLLGNGLLDRNEFNQLIESRDFLWRVRWANHWLSERAEERLLFEQQKQLAALFGYQDVSQPTHAVEQFMQSYYQHNTRLQRYNEHLLQQFREEFKAAEGAQTIPTVINGRFQIRLAYLEARSTVVFVETPLAILELFLILQQQPEIRGVRATTIRSLRQALAELEESQPEFFTRTETLRVFCQILQQPEGVYSQLERMNRYGLLAYFLPGFANVSGLMQFDLFHVYTVDQHTLFVVRNLRRMVYGKYTEQFAHANQLMPTVEQPSILYLAALFHDIAKGRGGDHAILGAADAQAFCRTADIPARHTELVAWLVRMHLLMSATAQRKDLSDPDVIQIFAAEVQTQQRLDYLYLLTVADIAATNPDLWTSWKDSLLWDLYQKTTGQFQRGLTNPVSRSMLIKETQIRVYDDLLVKGYPEKEITACWKGFSQSLFLRLDDDQLVWLSEILLSQQNNLKHTVELRQLVGIDVSEILVIGPSFDGFFATITSHLERMRCNIYSARIHNIKGLLADGKSDEAIVAIDLLQFTDASGQPIQQRDGERLRAEILEDLRKQQLPPPLRNDIPRRFREFLSTTKISIKTRLLNNEGSIDQQEYTELELYCIDRPGLLSMIALLLLKYKIRLHDARIATFGERVEDTFLLTDYADHKLSESICERLQQDILTSLEISI